MSSTTDELAEIDGIKPKVILTDGEEVEAKSKTSKAVYKIKRTWDHFYCTCPAWRNQSGAPVNARSCKHIREILGDSYEDARIKLKNPDAAPTKNATSKTKAKPKTQTQSKAVGKKKATDVEADGEPKKSAARRGMKRKAEEEEEEEVPKKKKPASTRAGKRKAKDEAEEDAIPVVKKPAITRAGKRKAEEEVLKGDDKEEEAEEEKTVPVATKPPSKRARSRKPNEEEENEEKLAGSAPKPTSKRGVKRKAPAEEPIDEEEEEGGEGEANDEKDDTSNKMDVDAPGPGDGDTLSQIKGVKPKRTFADGEEISVKSKTSNVEYKIKRTWDHYYWQAWRNQGGVPVNARTCKHLREVLGDKYESARVKMMDPQGSGGAKMGASKNAKNAPRKKARTGKGDGSEEEDGEDEEEEDGEEEEDDDKPAKKATKTKAKAPDMLLATKWDLEKGEDPTGWWVSEKLDGVRVLYDGKNTMLSRLGNPFTPPDWFIENLPKDVTLDGELFGGRGQFQSTVSIVKTRGSPHWHNITFQIFDVPSLGTKPFEERMNFLKETFGEGGTHKQKHVCIVEQTCAEGREHVLELLREVEGRGGEGLMLRKPESLYEGCRSSTLQKIKTFYDAEAKVTGHTPGKGKNKGSTGALKCVMASGKTFSVGTGLTDKQRRNPPKVGSIIVYRFQELTHDGVPRFPAFVGEAADKDEPKDAEFPEHRKGGAGGDA